MAPIGPTLISHVLGGEMPVATEPERLTVTEVRSKLLEYGDALATLQATAPADRGDTFEQDAREAIRAIHHFDAMLSAYEHGAEPVQTPRGPVAAMADLTARELRSPGEIFTGSEMYETRGGRYHGGNLPDVPAPNLIQYRHSTASDLELRTLLTTEQSDPAAGLWMPRGQPIPPLPRERRLFIRDVISAVGTTLNSVPYIRELNPATNKAGASSVAEGGLKPEVTAQFVQVDAPIRKLAAWIPVTTEIVEDAPTLRGYIDAMLGYMLALREEAEILNGNGVSPDLRGIRQTVGLQTQSAISGDRWATIGMAISKIEVVDGEPDFLAINPVDFWTGLVTRFANQMDGGFQSLVPFGPGPTQVFGLTPIKTNSMEAGKALVGSGRLGATILDRKQTVIRVGDQHADYMVYNKLLILAEERLGLMVQRPDFFVECTLS